MEQIIKVEKIDQYNKLKGVVTSITNNIELMLHYCIRFYERQFITRENINTDILSKLENLLNEYFQSNDTENLGLSSVWILCRSFISFT
jgi:hypothetical protein